MLGLAPWKSGRPRPKPGQPAGPPQGLTGRREGRCLLWVPWPSASLLAWQTPCHSCELEDHGMHHKGNHPENRKGDHEGEAVPPPGGQGTLQPNPNLVSRLFYWG